MSDLLFVVENQIATITLNRPAQRNTITYDMWCSFSELCSRIEADPGIRAVILHGVGDDAFSAGADVNEFVQKRHDPWQAQIYNGKVELALQSLLRLSRPTLALVKGYCLGGGCMLAAHCDLRIAADNSRFGLPAAKLGTLVGYNELQRFVHLIGVGATLDLLLTARLVDAQEARSIGLCTQVFPLDQIDQSVQGLTRQITQLAPLTQRWHKQMVQTVLQKPELVDLTAEEAMLPDACFDTADYAEGIQAFLEKRPPRFQGR